MNQTMGKAGEETALEFLQQQGYSLVCRNYRCRFGEIDLILRKDNLLIFAEVKTRRSQRYGLPRESVTPSKQNTIRKTALQYIQRYQIREMQLRYDVIEVYQNVIPEKVIHLANAFM